MHEQRATRRVKVRQVLQFGKVVIHVEKLNSGCNYGEGDIMKQSSEYPEKISGQRCVF